MKVKDQGKSLIKICVSLIAIIALIIVAFAYLFVHNKSYKNEAIERGDGIYLNGVRYCPVSADLGEYTISNTLIGKTDTGMKIYEIKEYPDYEYVAGYHAWDGNIYQRDDSESIK